MISGAMLYGDTGGQVSTEPLTVQLQDLPQSHDGSTAFTFRIAFSVAVTASENDVEDALSVSRGTVTAVTNVNDAGENFDVTIQPGGTKNVQMLLSNTTDCDDAGALCTADGRMLSSGASASVLYLPPQTQQRQTQQQQTPLTASFSSVPAEHDGSSRFTLDLEFSEAPVSLGLAAVREDLFDVTGGAIEKVRRINPPSNLGYRLWVKPSSNDDVTLTRVATLPACGEPRSVCTEDGAGALEHAFGDGGGSGGSFGGGRRGRRRPKRGTQLRGDAEPGGVGDGDGGLRDLGTTAHRWAQTTRRRAGR